MSELDASYASHPLRGVTRRALWARMRGRRLPITQGQLRVPGPEHSFTVTRDRWAIPHIRARNSEDAAFSLGFCHGQDRSLQLTLLHAWVHGRLSERVGPLAVAADRIAHRLQLPGWAASVRVQLPPWAKRSLERYACGVRAGQSRGRLRRCPGHHLLRTHPSDFLADDALAILLFRLLSGSLAGADAWGLWGLGEGSALETLDLEARLRQASAAPSLPNPHYLAHLETPAGFVAGAGWVGTPVFAVAQDGAQGWTPEWRGELLPKMARRQELQTLVVRPRGARSRSSQHPVLVPHAEVLEPMAKMVEDWFVPLQCGGEKVGGDGRRVSERVVECSLELAATRGDARSLVLEHPVSRLRPRMSAAWSVGPLVLGSRKEPLPLVYELEVGSPESGRFSYPGGQSGNPLSAHYDDLVPTWMRGRGVPVLTQDADIESHAQSRLVVEPGS